MNPARLGLLILLLALTAIIVAVVWALAWTHARRRRNWFLVDLSLDPPPPPQTSTARWPIGLCAGLLIGLTIYFLAIGFSGAGPGLRLTAALVAAGCLAAAACAFTYLRRDYSDGIADAAAALICLALAATSVAIFASGPGDLAHRYPAMLNAAMAGLSVSALLWVWLSEVWEQQLDEGRAWTVAGRLRAPVVRAAFFSAVLAVGAGFLMAIWPRLSVAAAMDHSLGRVAAGVAGHLLLLLAVLWCGRTTKRPAFISLAVFTLAGMIAFVYVRWEPLTTASF